MIVIGTITAAALWAAGTLLLATLIRQLVRRVDREEETERLEELWQAMDGPRLNLLAEEWVA